MNRNFTALPCRLYSPNVNDVAVLEGSQLIFLKFFKVIFHRIPYKHHNFVALPNRQDGVKNRDKGHNFCTLRLELACNGGSRASQFYEEYILFVKPIRSLLIQRIPAGSSFWLLA